VKGCRGGGAAVFQYDLPGGRLWRMWVCDLLGCGMHAAAYCHYEDVGGVADGRQVGQLQKLQGDGGGGARVRPECGKHCHWGGCDECGSFWWGGAWGLPTEAWCVPRDSGVAFLRDGCNTGGEGTC
jgi:hypothetical protein